MSTKQIVAGRLKFASESEAAAAARSLANRQAARVFDVPVVVDEERCITGCHICVACEVDCPTNAITVKIPFLLR